MATPSTTITHPHPPGSDYGVDDINRSTNPITLTRFLLAERQRFHEATGAFAMLLQSIQLAVKVISNATRKAGIAQLYGLADTGKNTTGDDQKKLDIFANETFINCLTFSDQASVLVSEENDKPIVLGENAGENTGGYCVVFDPLDGSSNIDCNLSVGTIFGIYKKKTPGSPASSPSKDSQKPGYFDVLRPGHELLAAGYALYDAATMIVLTTGSGVNGFTLDASLGEFVLTHKNIRIPKKGKIYSINEGNASAWDDATKQYIDSCKTAKKSARYVGSMVGDVHRTMLYGGIFAYPADTKAPAGKLRLLYECNPMSFLMEQAGGRSTTGTHRILDIVPQSIHQRSAIWLGSEDDVKEVERIYKELNVKPGHKPVDAKKAEQKIAAKL